MKNSFGVDLSLFLLSGAFDELAGVCLKHENES